jgi:CobQ-like glutamine amidotransferase family enzyme
MNMYGDTGNAIILKKRIELRGYKAEIIDYNIGDNLPSQFDILTTGGGMDSSQAELAADLQKIGPSIKKFADNGGAILAICGMYQLFGKYFQTRKGEKIPGIGVFNIWTEAGDKRIIGNIITESERFGKLIGYENHSGKTYLEKNAHPLAEQVTLGIGNGDLAHKTEGVIYKNSIGTYLHGPLLAKNPQISDFLIQSVISKELSPIKSIDQITIKARNVASKLSR